MKKQINIQITVTRGSSCLCGKTASDYNCKYFNTYTTNFKKGNSPSEDKRRK